MWVDCDVKPRGYKKIVGRTLLSKGEEMGFCSKGTEVRIDVNAWL